MLILITIIIYIGSEFAQPIRETHKNWKTASLVQTINLYMRNFLALNRGILFSVESSVCYLFSLKRRNRSIAMLNLLYPPLNIIINDFLCEQILSVLSSFYEDSTLLFKIITEEICIF